MDDLKPQENRGGARRNAGRPRKHPADRLVHTLSVSLTTEQADFLTQMGAMANLTSQQVMRALIAAIIDGDLDLPVSLMGRKP